MQKNDFEKLVSSAKEKAASFPCRIYCCSSTGCISSGCKDIVTSLKEAITSHGLQDKVRIVQTGCMGLCSHGPLARVEINDLPPVLYSEVKPVVARLIVAEHVIPALEKNKDDKFELPEFLSQYTLPLDLPFFTKQKKIALASAGRIDPESIEDFLANDGYKALQITLESMSPEEVIKEVTISGLRGRGGGGYPTGLKWKNARLSDADEKFMICNGDEGDPGAYMDRSILEGDPHAVIEGLAIAAYATNATSGWV